VFRRDNRKYLLQVPQKQRLFYLRYHRIVEVFQDTEVSTHIAMTAGIEVTINTEAPGLTGMLTHLSVFCSNLKDA
jgi:hypothetical protein